MRHITLNQAEQVIAAAKKRAAEIGVGASVAILDHGGHLVTFSRMDGAFLGSIDLATKKAKASAMFPFETQQIWELSKPGGEAHGIELSNGLLITFEGGIPLRDPVEGAIGSIGVSGGSAAQDYEIAKAGAAALAS